eukprot:gene34975-43129_t
MTTPTTRPSRQPSRSPTTIPSSQPLSSPTALPTFMNRTSGFAPVSVRYEGTNIVVSRFENKTHAV